MPHQPRRHTDGAGNQSTTGCSVIAALRRERSSCGGLCVGQRGQCDPLRVVTLDNWVKVRDRSGALYWVEKRLLSSTRYVYALKPLVDVRAEPDFGAVRVFQVRQQIALELIEPTGTGWVKVRHQDGNIGYVRSTEVWGN